MENEIWKPVVGFEGLYEVSSFGRVKSLERVMHRKNSGDIVIKERIMCPTPNFKGYLYVKLYNYGRPKMKKIHRLVAEAFIPNPLNKPHIDHIDTDKRNNNVDNLRWVTASENKNNELTRELHRRIMDAAVTRKCLDGRMANNSETMERTVLQFSKDGELIKEFHSLRSANDETGAGVGHISAVCHGKRKTAGGYIWKYKDI